MRARERRLGRRAGFTGHISIFIVPLDSGGLRTVAPQLALHQINARAQASFFRPFGRVLHVEGVSHLLLLEELPPDVSPESQIALVSLANGAPGRR